jgi:transposase
MSNCRFEYKHQEEYFNYKTYVRFLEECIINKFYSRGHRVFLIQDNASYHKKPETYEWFSKNRKYVEVACLPRYTPELNAIERVWHYTRMEATHNRFHENVESLCQSLFQTFDSIQKKPDLIKGLITPFC